MKMGTQDQFLLQFSEEQQAIKQTVKEFAEKLEVKPEGFIAYKLDADKEDWVSGIICKNPFYYDKKVGEFLSRHEKIIVNLRSHHPLKTDKQYYLERVRIIQIPYGVFGFKILNIRGDW